MYHILHFSNSFFKRICFLSLILFSTSYLKAQIWTEVGGLNGLAPNNMIMSMCSDKFGNIYAGGQFTNSNGKRFVAKWDGTTWSELGGLNALGANANICDLCTDTLGNIYAVGGFTNASSKNYVAKWDGINWTELGGLNGLSVNGYIYSIYIDNNGIVYVAGLFSNITNSKFVAKWDGISWSEVGGLNSLGANASIFAICGDSFGNIYAAGGFKNASGSKYVAKWDGVNWSEVGGLNSLAAIASIQSICVDTLGNVYVAGAFINASGKQYVAKWDGINWSEVGGLNALSANYDIKNICFDNANRLYAAGWFTNGTSSGNGNAYVAQWNGIGWSEVGGFNGLAANGAINKIMSDKNGNIFAGGNFHNVNGHQYVAKYGICRMYDTITASIINGNNYVFNSDTLTIAGMYNDTLNTSITGCDSVVTLILSVLPNGVNDLEELNSNMQVFPNPTSDIMTVSINNNEHKTKFKIIDLTGNVIAEQLSETSKKTIIDLSKLSKGIYFVECQYKDKVLRRKVIKN